MLRTSACILFALVGAACSSSGEAATAPAPKLPAPADPIAHAPATPPQPIAGEMYLVWVRPEAKQGQDAPPPHTVLLDETGNQLGTAPGIWVAAGDELWRIVRNQRDHVARCADGTTPKGSSLELDAIETQDLRTVPLLPPAADATKHVARVDRSVGRYLFVTASDDGCAGAATVATTRVIDLTGGQVTEQVGDDALAAESALPPSVAATIAAMPSVGGVSHAMPAATWRAPFGDPALQAALMAAFEPGFAKGDVLYTNCLGDCSFTMPDLSCDLAKGRCEGGNTGVPDRASAKASARIIAAMQALDRMDGKGRCGPTQCKKRWITCDWPRDHASQAICKQK